MSFLASSQRGYDSLVHSDLALPSISPSSRHQMHFPQFDSNSLPPLAPSASAPAAAENRPSPPSTAADDDSAVPPRVGQTRCYWSLLTPDLHFLYLDPVLAAHLGEQAEALVGKSLLAFVHPDEQASAKLDLGSVLESRTLHGSVTRVRYSRLARVRRQLGYTGPEEEWPDAKKVCFDEDYMGMDVVINWASDGLVLCFMHAVTDLTPRDNDEVNKTGWTNWCGTPSMSAEQVQLLYQRLLSGVPQPLSMSRVFQILLNQPDRSLLISWPPEQEEPGGPTSKDFAKLAQDVQITSGVSSSTDAKTSCTRRYKAHQTMHFGADSSKEVESIFIPHGSIIFACHKVNPSTRQLNPNNAGPHQLANPQYPSQVPYYDQPPSSYSLPPVPAPNASYSGFPPPSHHGPPQYPSGPWPHHPDSPNSQPHYQWSTHNGPITSGPSVSSVRSSSYAPAQQTWPPQQGSYMDAGPAGPPAYNQSQAPSGSPYPPPGTTNEDTPPSPGSDYVPPSRINNRRGSGNTRDQYGSGGRSSGNPPVGISRCASCKVTHSPEWRKGPSGKKDLCNACGLRYARSRAKKDGALPTTQSMRKRKDRVLSNLQKEHSPSGSPIPAGYSDVRRGYYDEGSFASTSSTESAATATGDMYPPHPGFNNISPSPSPSSGGSHYIPYAQAGGPAQNPHGETRHYTTTGTAYYSVPPPAPPVQSAHAASYAHAAQAPPRLEPIVPYSARVSPQVSPATPAPASPNSATISVASFEREKAVKEQEQEGLPPSPVLGEARRMSGGRSGYAQE
ncbi:hypothetical protein WOLCODRAFT_120211 [Wolfiporia cocos MD-104 SS10]|uniref:GATA-type domain-containing protein n=1 Tax=Wolfiporia cocos (strain MD-104) TaxID=742152 RepID=A0A2H3JJA4_WOLCO|nr:hypothetical protein WOLCODRAFT_120211 [Wolfiporia cocos MD-104 SS10]